MTYAADNSKQPDHRWLVSGFSTERNLAGRPPGILWNRYLHHRDSISGLGRRLENPSVAVALVDAGVRKVFQESVAPLLRELQGSGRAVVVLVPWKTPPTKMSRFDGDVTSFISSAAVFRDLKNRFPECPPAELCFRLLFGIMNREISVDRVVVRQLPLAEFVNAPRTPPAPNRIGLVMAHRGKRRHLETALAFLSCAADRPRCRIGLDVEDASEYDSLREAYPWADFFHFKQNPVGPYIVRQELAHRSRERSLVFHDSDDISCADRFVALSQEMRSTGCHLLGCHQLQVDERTREVTATRFPRDASAALKAYCVHALWHPTSMVRRTHFFRSGGFSVDRIFSNDTQFLLRAWFSMKIRNADAFLYIRRKHEGALTVMPETALDTPVRIKLQDLWQADFEAVKNGTLQLAASSLRPFPAWREYQVVPLGKTTRSFSHA